MKAQLLEGAFIMFFIFGVFVFLAVLGTAFVKVNQAGVFNSSTPAATFFIGYGRFLTAFDNGLILSLALFGIGLFLSGWRILTNPMYFIISIIGFPLTILAGILINNVSDVIINASGIAEGVALLPKMQIILQNSVPLTIIFGFIFMLGLYIKPFGGNQTV